VQQARHLRTWPWAFALATGTLRGPADPDIIVHVGDPIRQDDFVYRVRSVSARRHIGDLRPSGLYRLITFAVENRARRINHLWDNAIGYLVTGDGRTFENDTSAQRALDLLVPFGWKDRYVTPADESQETTLVFDVPQDAAPLYLKVRGELLMGDVLAFNPGQRTRVQLG